jgi:hypothetical protein
MERTFHFRFWCGPCAVREITEKLNSHSEFTATAGTEHVYGTFRMAEGMEWPAREFAIEAKRALGFDPGFVKLEERSAIDETAHFRCC